MITFRVSADVNSDRRVVLTLPAEVPTGKAELIVSIQPEGPKAAPRQRSSLADWAEQNAEHWGDQLRAEDVDSFTGRRF
jgi:hypothetical protein